MLHSTSLCFARLSKSDNDAMGTNRKKFHGFSRAQRSALRTKEPLFEVKTVEKAPQPTMSNTDEEPVADNKEGDLEMDQDQAETLQGTNGGSEDTEKENSASAKRVKDRDADQYQEEMIEAKRHKTEHETKGRRFRLLMKRTLLLASFL